MRISVRSDRCEIIYELNDSRAAEELYAQLPLATKVEPFSNNEMTFYPKRLSTKGRPFPAENRVLSPITSPGAMWSCFTRRACRTAACMNWGPWFQGKNLLKA